MSKRSRIRKILISEELDNNDMEEKAKKKKLVALPEQEIFSDDICFEIISMIDDSWFILKNCVLISKQFFNVIKERSKLVIKFKKKFTGYRIKLFMNSRFMSSIVDVKFSEMLFNSEETPKFINEMTKMKQLTSLDISYNLIYAEGAKSISEMKQLTSLDIGGNRIYDKGAKFISELKQLKSLNIYNDWIGIDGIKPISEMKQLTSLDIGRNHIGDEVAKFISDMKQLTSLTVNNNRIGVEGAKFISEMKQLKSLGINNNQIYAEGAKFISEMKQLTSLDISDNQIYAEGAKFIITIVLVMKEPSS
ncbi:predicted protein [Naegleria gruberi]|uniref:Predicted protein n=1 Tax=Naegleria gruberi TaxID=5762 RepID=D2VB15_NAEGR|nr:uncharacterized protein NAEGRDRAFT_66053 [Naegleria gruberi]EFC46179.1 predicted protein [Naegleria gruberi]|eukprot:XP_002678923.1 predicted protein [Naegleria gruberi strain NEG-M]